jgi:hypothetical protein
MEELIVALARDATPVTPLRPPAVRLAVWFALTVLCGVLGLSLYGLRADSAVMTAQPGFARDVVLGLTLVGLGGASALILAVPGAERQGVMRWGATAALAAWLLLASAAVVEQGQGFTDMRHWPVCIVRLVSVALVPAVTLIAMVRRGAPLRPAWAAGLAVAAAASGGALTILLTCPIGDPDHVLLGHALPVAAFAALAVLRGVKT